MIGAASSLSGVALGAGGIIAILGAAWIGAWALRRGARDDRHGHDEVTAAATKVAQESATNTAYDLIVGRLQIEVTRQGVEIAGMRADLETCRTESQELRNKLEAVERRLPPA